MKITMFKIDPWRKRKSEWIKIMEKIWGESDPIKDQFKKRGGYILKPTFKLSATPSQHTLLLQPHRTEPSHLFSPSLSLSLSLSLFLHKPKIQFWSSSSSRRLKINLKLKKRKKKKKKKKKDDDDDDHVCCL